MQFDNQADSYDQRTGLGEATAQQIAAAVKSLITPYLNGTLLEIGAGTGEIGYYLQDLGLPYVGIDLSGEMLRHFRARFTDNESLPRLIQMDGNLPWPFPEEFVSVFFSSRAMHQLDHEHVLQQLVKLATPEGALLILGNTKRSPDSSKAIMRKEMHKLLNSFGLSEKSGQSNRKQLFEALEQQGCQRLPTLVAACWQAQHAPIESIQSWESVEGIAGLTIDPALKAQILAQLQLNAQKLFTDIHRVQETEEVYELNAIKLTFN